MWARNLIPCDRRLGTFARVWLARLKDQDDKSKVYALKILRKADGEHALVSRLRQGTDG